MSSKDAMADIHAAAGELANWETISKYTLLVNIRWLDNEALAGRCCTGAGICGLWGRFLLEEQKTDSKPAPCPYGIG